MKTFQQFLSLFEVAEAYLYHTTKLSNMHDILKSDVLYTSQQSNGSKAVSLSRDSRYIRPYLEYQNYVRIILDKNKLNQYYKIIPYSECEVGKDGQCEEHINTKIKHLSKFIIKIDLFLTKEITDVDADGYNQLIDSGYIQGRKLTVNDFDDDGNLKNEIVSKPSHSLDKHFS
jgi:hypothetical protein